MTMEEALNPKINEKLAHLEKDEIDEILRYYYAGEKITDLLEMYEINASEYGFINIFPPEVVRNTKCKYCNLPLWKDRKSKTAYFDTTPYCPSCKHTESEKCTCQNCTKEKKEQERKEMQRVRSILSKKINISIYKPYDYRDLPDLYKIYLGAVVRAGVAEDLAYIKPFSLFDEKLTPCAEFDNEIHSALIDLGILKIHPQSTIDCFVDVQDNGSYRYYPKKVFWHINVSLEDDSDSVINKLMNLDGTAIDHDLILSIWKKIALYECLEYLEYQLSLVDLLYDTGEKTKLVFNDLLNTYSVGQIYGIIWSGVTNAVRFLQEKHVPRENAAKAVITNCQRHGEKAIIEGWNVKTFNRIQELPQTAISKYFYNRVVKIGENGFIKKPE